MTKESEFPRVVYIGLRFDDYDDDDSDKKEPYFPVDLNVDCADGEIVGIYELKGTGKVCKQPASVKPLTAVNETEKGVN